MHALPAPSQHKKLRPRTAAPGTIALALLSFCAIARVAVAHDDEEDPGRAAEGASTCLARFYDGDPGDRSPGRSSGTWRCADGDPLCDRGPGGDGSCDFAIGVCLNNDAAACAATPAASVVVRNRPLGSTRHAPDLAALQTTIDALAFPARSQTVCTEDAVGIRVARKGPRGTGKRTVKMQTTSWPSPETGKVRRERIRLRLLCVPSEHRGSFDVIAEHVFAQTCAAATCHGTDLPQGNLSLEPTRAYGSLVNVLPQNPVAAAAGMKLVDPGNPDNSFLMRKLCGPDPGDPALRPAVCAGHDLVHVHHHGPGPVVPDEGHPMPPTGSLPDAYTTFIHAWILAGAPPAGWAP